MREQETEGAAVERGRQLMKERESSDERTK